MNPIVKIRIEPHPDADDFVIVVEESGGVYTIRHDNVSSPITASESVKIDGIKLTVEAP